MDYIITDAGLKILEETGLRKVVDENFRGVTPLSHFYDEDIEDYIEKNRTHPSYRAKIEAEIEAEESHDSDDEFKIFSYIYPNELARTGKIPKNLPDDLMVAIGAYFSTKWWTEDISRRAYTFRNNQFQTCINGDTHGDFFLQQYNHVPKKDLQGKLFEDRGPLIKKLEEQDKGKLYGHYDYWIEFLNQLIMFCCQEGIEVPFKNDWEQVFYDGKLPSDEPGSVSEFTINNFKKGDIEFLKNCLPRLPGWEKQKVNGWNPLEGEIENSRAFIIGGNLVYCNQDKEGQIEFACNRYSKPKVIFTPDMIKETIYGTMTLIRDGTGRNQPQDPGLVMRYFPYHLYSLK